MSDLISRSALIKLRRKVVEYDEAGFSMDYFAVPVEEIKNAPTVEARPVVTGEWINRKNWDKYVCSVCSHEHDDISNFCEHCGCDMRGGKNE